MLGVQKKFDHEENLAPPHRTPHSQVTNGPPHPSRYQIVRPLVTAVVNP